MFTTSGSRRVVAFTTVGATLLAPLVHTASASAEVAMAEAIAVQNDSDNAGIRAQGQTLGQLGGQYRITGQKWCFGDKKTGQWVGVKLLDGEDSNSGIPVNMDDAHKSVPQPDGTNSNNLGKRGVIAMLKASDDPTGAGNCSLDATVTLPDASNSDATVDRFPQGAKRSLVLLAGSFGPGATSGGTAPHGATLGMTVGEPVQVVPSREVSIAAERTQGVVGQYQGAYSAKTGKYYVTGVASPSATKDAAGVVTLKDQASTIAEYDPATGKVVRVAQLPLIPAGTVRNAETETGLVTEVHPFGIAVDDARGLIWTTDTRQNTVSAYDLATFKQVWRSAEGTVPHGREVYLVPNGANPPRVIAGGTGGLYEITGSGTSYDVTQHEVFGAGDKSIAVGGTVVGDKLAVTSVSSGDAHGKELLVVDPKTWTTASYPLNPESQAEKVSHGGLAYDASTHVIVQVDQGTSTTLNGVATRSGSGVNFFTDAGAPLGRVTVGSQNLSAVVDEAADIAYVGDFNTGEVRAFDLRAAAAGAPTQIGETDVMTTNARGVNHLAAGAQGVLVVGKDKSFPGVTEPWGAKFKGGERVPFTGDADSLSLLKVTESAGTFDPKTDIGHGTSAAPYDLAGVVIDPKPPVTPTTTVTTEVPTTITTTVPTTVTTEVPTTVTTAVPTTVGATVTTVVPTTVTTAVPTTVTTVVPTTITTTVTTSPSASSPSSEPISGSLGSLTGIGGGDSSGSLGSPLLAGILGLGGLAGGILLGVFTPLLHLFGMR